ncbi:carboxyl transferase domain-containing protein [Tsukamurella sp. 8F]|uniref:acetyl-CoA carboxylase family protein n=1 Tax=unclassified Tsukamurella TaxID=2633480 RepID=UPI0023B8F921|nr:MULTISPECIES: carboxyl transferase domain-containing protein [unclassified Tsukamurella]MDF0529703.1 carboxyl transferase domain-containing protein [Tsukamurella sp. 8J]MDF0585988.1 carboxyl transferase domain-containing protein [Tsukamurella sp. 8F]
MTRVLIANRGEIALRIVRAAAESGLESVALYASDDADTPHVHAASVAVALPGSGPAAYLDAAAVVAAGVAAGASVVHPGYGFLSENAGFARACAAAGLVFAGPTPELLELFGDKASARAAATAADVPVLPATEGAATLDQVRGFLAAHPGGIMIKAVAGGGGRGMRVVRSDDALDAAYAACAAEAERGFGSRDVFAEKLFEDPRHVEVQIVADGSRALAIGDRDCSVQRRHQKLIETAPAPDLGTDMRRALHIAASRLLARAGYRGVATVEFLVGERDSVVFLEVNPRIQVEHTVTEEVTGVDLVGAQLALAQGAMLSDLDLPPGISSCGDGVDGDLAAARGFAMQARVNAETLAPDGAPTAASGTLAAFTPPSGPGIRVDTYGRPGLVLGARYDPLLAKVVARAASYSAATAKLRAALGEFVIDGVATSIPVLRAMLADQELAGGPVTTGFVADRLPALIAEAPAQPVVSEHVELRAGEEVARAPMAGTVVSVVREGDEVPGSAPLAVLEAMKMEHVIVAPVGARAVRVLARPGCTVASGDPLVLYTVTGSVGAAGVPDVDLDAARDDLAEILDRHAATEDAARPEAVAKMRRRGRRTVRENISDLVDDGSFVEYGGLVVAAQRSRRSEEDLIANTPADGLVGGVATIGADRFDAAADVAVLGYDYTVLAGTQGWRNHAKTDRVLEIAGRRRLPVIVFAEGGGGRPGDTDLPVVAGLDVPTFRTLGALSGEVPLVAVVSGRCFAGNAAMAGTCDVIIATPDANIGMGGPAMISGGGLGDHRPEEIGPIDVQRRNGVVHLVARDDAHAVELARRYLSYFQGPIAQWEAPDPRIARHIVPRNRLRAYDIRAAIDAVADVGSVLELRADHAVGVVTALVRVEGVAYGLIANSSHHLGGAIDAEGADKLADFLTLCETHGLPVVSFCDTPGFMVGPDAETTATVRRFSRLFVIGAHMTVPIGAFVLRKGYGLGAMAMTAGSFRAPDFTVAWPTGEIGGMGLEGAVRLGFSKELAAKEDAVERQELFDRLVALAYERGKALAAATVGELDDVIDPADTRRWIARLAR